MSNHTCAIDGRPAHRRARTGDGYWCNACYEWSRRHEWADPAARTRHATAQPGRGCDVEGCSRPHKSNGFCDNHYGQWRRHGSPTVYVKRRPGELEAELTAAATARTNECILLGGRAERVLVFFRGKATPAARAVWTIANGDPGEAHVLHKCNGGSGAYGCINRRHLYLGDHARNMLDMVIAGRSQKGRTDVRGSAVGTAVLTEEAVREIRRRYVPGRPYHPGNRAALAAEYGITEATVKDAVTRRSWQHVT